MKRDRGQDEQVKSRGSKESLLLRDRQTCKERKGYGGTDARRIKNRECDPQKIFSLDLPPVGMFALLDVFWVSKFQIVLRLRPLAKDLSQFVGIDEDRPSALESGNATPKATERGTPQKTSNA